jgi:hypothetical protein
VLDAPTERLLCAHKQPFHNRSFRELNPRQLTRNIGPPLTPQRVRLSLLRLVVARFSLISRCTHRAHAAFQLIEKIQLSLQSIMGAMLKRRSNILTLFRFFVSAAIADFWADGSSKGQLKHFLFVSSAYRKSLFGPIKLTPCAVQLRYRMNSCSTEMQPQAHTHPRFQSIHPRKVQTQSNALRSPLLT